nr:helix-turn-helix domain-containing protein [Methylobacterium sp. L1A1]
MFADHLRAAIEAAPRITLPAVAAQLWRAYGEGQVSEAEAEALSGLIEAQRGNVGVAHNADEPGIFPRSGENLPLGQVSAPRRVGSRPRTDASMERRRRWAASGRLPPALAAQFTLAEQAVLSLVAAETARRKDCRLAIENIAAVAGVSRSTVKNAIREAVKLGLVTVEEREITGWRNDTNIVRIISPEWVAWLRLTRKKKDEVAPALKKGGGVKSSTTTPTVFPILGSSGIAGPSQGLPRGSGRPDPKRSAGNRGGK